MHIELSGTVRGERAAVCWHDGHVDGSEVLLRRLEPLVADERCDLADPTSVIRCLEQVAGQRMALRVLDEHAAPGRVTAA